MKKMVKNQLDIKDCKECLELGLNVTAYYENLLNNWWVGLSIEEKEKIYEANK